MELKIVIATISFAGVIIGALLQNLFHRRNEKIKHFTELRARAYIDFVNAVAELANVAKSNKKRPDSTLIKLADAKTRIVIYGDDTVISSMSDFMKKYGRIDTQESFNSFYAMIEAMRKDATGQKNTASIETISNILFGKDTTDFK